MEPSPGPCRDRGRPVMLGIQFGVVRLIILTLWALAQIYLFFYIRRAIRSSCRSDRFKFRAILLVGAAVSLLSAMSGYNLFRPTPWIDPPMAARIGLFYLPAAWSFGSILSALLLGVMEVAGWLLRMIVQLRRGRRGQGASTPADPGRRRFLQAGVGGLAAAPLILSGYGAAYVGRTYSVQNHNLPFGCPLRVVQLTDIHAGVYMTRKTMRRYADQVIALQPDLFVLTGDFVSNSLVFLPGCLEEMARVHTRYGTFAVLGNHEHWYGRLGKLRMIFQQSGIPLLRNEHRVIQTQGRPFAVAGIDDMRTGNPDLEAALRGLPSTIPTILLSHRPEIFPRAAAYGIPLTLAGHYHGGQIKLSLPGGDFSLAHLRTVYPEGLYRIDDSRLYVSRGIGVTFTPIRLNAPPEVTLLNLT